MEKVKRELKETYEKHLKEGASQQEALLKTVTELRNKHDREKFKEALKGFLEETLDSFKPENLSEADPVLAFIESAYEEWDILKAKLETLFGKKP
jgi:ferritin-like metal-binding protein YciE